MLFPRACRVFRLVWPLKMKPGSTSAQLTRLTDVWGNSKPCSHNPRLAVEAPPHHSHTMKPIHALVTLTLVLCGQALAAEQKPLKVFILAGQSNMEGHAKIETFDYIGDDPATAPYDCPKSQRILPHLRETAGDSDARFGNSRSRRCALPITSRLTALTEGTSLQSARAAEPHPAVQTLPAPNH